MKTTRTPFRAGRKEQRTPLKHEDAYREDAKLADPTICPDCHATFKRGRWTWEAADPGAPQHRCPACRRIHDGQPAGHVTLQGPFFAGHRDEVLGLAFACEAGARQEHPMQRIIGAQDLAGGGVVVTTTDAHLARGIAVAIHDAFKGDLDIDFGKQENFVRATWSR